MSWVWRPHFSGEALSNHGNVKARLLADNTTMKLWGLASRYKAWLFSSRAAEKILTQNTPVHSTPIGAYLQSDPTRAVVPRTAVNTALKDFHLRQSIGASEFKVGKVVGCFFVG